MDRTTGNGSDLRSFFWPRAIAVVGASADVAKPGGRVVKLLREFHFPGAVFPVNPGRREIQGLTGYGSLEEVSDRADLVVVALPAGQVPAAVEQCGLLGLKNVIVISGGFAEVGGEGMALQARLEEAAAAHGLRLLGPNCIGFINSLQPAAASFALNVDSGVLRPGPAAFVAQSGGLGVLALFLADQEGLGVSYVVSTGNEAGIDFPAVLSFLANEPAVRVIGGYLEGVRSGEALRLACREAAAANKPVILLKAGASTGAVEAIRSHTGALAGSDEAYRAFFRQEGVLEAASMTELLSLLKAFAPGRLPAGNRAAVFSLSGGMGVLAADYCAAAGLELAAFAPHTNEGLSRLMPSIATVRNPLDPTAVLVTRLDVLRAALEIIMDDPAVDMLIFITALWRIFGTAAGEMLAGLLRRNNKPLVVIWPGCAPDTRKLICASGIPFYEELAEGARAAGALWRYAAFLRRRREAEKPPAGTPAGAAVRAAAVLGKRDGGNLTEAETKEILAAYGIAVPRGNLVKTAGEAAAAARRIGFPVALKVVSPEITHKTEVGGISLGLADEAQLRLAWDRMRLELAAKLPAVVPEGFLVEEMLPVRLELIVGARNDPVFGPLLLLGPGGVLVELNRDLSLHFAPVSPARVVEMIGELKSAALFQGFRGSAAVDLNPLAEAVSRFSRLAADLRGSYREIEINPLALCAGGRVAAADALLLR